MNVMTPTSFTHPEFKAKIHLAMEEAVKHSKAWSSRVGQSYTRNRKQRPCLRVNHHRGEPQAFQFWIGNANVTNWVLECLRKPGTNQFLLSTMRLGSAPCR